MASGTRTADDPETWLAEHGDYLYRYALFRCRDPHRAEDLVQETLLAALVARERRRGTSSVRTWLTGILNHKFIDALRRQYRESPREDEKLEDLVAENEKAGSTSPAEWRDDPAALIEDREFRRQFESCVAKLNRRMFDAYTLREMEGWTPEAICNELSLSPTNLRVILHRAREQLRRCLEPWFRPGKDSPC